jgi:hypothetical protein
MSTAEFHKFEINLLLFLTLVLTSCNAYKPVVVNSVGNIKTINPLSNPEIQFDVGLKNPNNFGVTITKMEIGICVGEPVLATVSLLHGTRIGKGQTISVPVSLKPSVKDVSSLFNSGIDSFLSGKKDKKLQVVGELTVKKFIFKKRYEIKESIRW